MDAVNERELVERCRAGDERAFQDLVDRYKDLVYAMIARTVQDRSRAEDLAQDVFLRIHRGLPYFRGEARLSTWIYRIVANVCVQEFGRPAAAISLDDEPSKHQAAVSAPDRRFGDLELKDRLEKAIARLLEQKLRARTAPPAPPQFTTRTLARVRGARWRSDQFLDVGFNVAVIAVVVAVFAGVWMLLHRSGLDAVSGDVVDLFGSGLVAFVHSVAPSLPLYFGAALLLVSALGLWWWAERDAAL